MTHHAKAVLLLQDGTAFEGAAFGAEGEALGETVFYTGVVGYQEVLTDPAYRGTLVVLTYPIIGSYGVNDEDNESPAVQARGVVLRDYSPYYSNFRATGALEDFLRERGVVGIRGIDTRAVTVHLREHGEQKGLIAPADADRSELLARLQQAPSPFEADLVRELEPARPPAGGTHKLAVLDAGLKTSLMRQLAALDCALQVLPPTASADEVLATGAARLLVVGGPGDPRRAGYLVETTRALLGKLPILGIGLGHQVLGLALGCQVRRLRAGHHGLNQAVKNVVAHTSQITVQHHSFVVARESLPANVEITHLNVNDETVEGLRSRDHPAGSVQFHPTPDETGRPNPVLRRFLEPSGPTST